MTTRMIHYGVMFSYYSAKTRAYLSYKHIPFIEMYHAGELSGRIRETTHKVMIPVVETPEGDILQDTTIIIDTLERRFPERPVFPDDPVLMLITRLVEFIIDELWISTAMNSRWNDPVSKQFIISEFGRRIGGSVGLTGADALAMGTQVAEKMQSYLPALGVADTSGQATASAFFEEASLALNDAVSATHYALGPRPSLLDFCLFTGYYAHQYRDPGKAQLFLKTQTPDLSYYLDNLHAGYMSPDAGELALTDALLHYLKTVGPSGAGFARGLIEGTQAVLSTSKSGEVFEQALSPVTFDLAGEPFTSGTGRTFSAWKLQRVMDNYTNMSEQNRARADEITDAIGWHDLLKINPGYRLERKDHLTHLA